MENNHAVAIMLEHHEWVRVFLDKLPSHKLAELSPKETKQCYLIDLGARKILVPKVRGYAPGLAKDVESMVADFHITHVLRLGTCGGYNQAHRPGDVVLCTAAIRGEGTSFCYVEDARFPAAADFELTRIVAAELEKQDIGYRAGLLWTTDGRIAGQYDTAVIERMRSRNVLGVEMQSAALFILGHRFGFKVSSIAIVVDLPLDHDPFAPVLEDHTKVAECLDVLVNVALRL